MARVLVLDGGDHKDPVVDKISALIGEVLGQRGWDVDLVSLRNLRLEECTGCLGCWTMTPGRCVIDDDGNDLLRRFQGSDLVISIGDVTFGNPPYLIKVAMERRLPLLLPLMASSPSGTRYLHRYERRPKEMHIGLSERPTPSMRERLTLIVSEGVEDAVIEVVDVTWTWDRVNDVVVALLNEAGVL